MISLRQEKRRGFGVVKLLCIVALVALVVAAVWLIAPQIFRIQGIQTPVSMKVRDSVVGKGKVVQVRNESEKPLDAVVVTALDPKSNAQARYKIDRLEPEETKDIGWVEWEWKVAAGQRMTVDAKGYAPIVFTSGQLGIE
ncbi:MAG: hypothetical protein ABIF82_00815 [Planctomycetota bacterium]